MATLNVGAGQAYMTLPAAIAYVNYVATISKDMTIG